MSSQIVQHFHKLRKDDRFEQIDFLYLMHRLESKKQKIRDKFEKLETKRQISSDKETRIKIEALNKIAKEINQKIGDIKEKISQSFNFSDLCHGLELLVRVGGDKKVESYFPERLTGSIIPMECEHCDYHSDLFMIECPICQSELAPSILRRFRVFKSIYLSIEKKYSLRDLLHYERSSDVSFNISDSDFKKMSAFLVSFFSLFYSHNYFNIFSLYAWNFRYLLKKDYLYRFRKSFLEELSFIEKKMNVYQESSEEYSHLIINMELTEDEKPFFFLSRILGRYIQKVTNRENMSDEEKIVNYLVVHAINELIRRLKAKLLQFDGNFKKGIREFTEWLFEFSLKEDEYCVIPQIFLKYLESEEIQSTLYKLELELYYLPTKNTHLVVKQSFDPDLKPLEKLTKKRGGLSVFSIEEELKLSYIEAALLIQVLLRRKLGISTYSYLKGRKFYLRI